MPEPFSITTPTKILKLDDKGHAQAAFAVHNVGGNIIPHGRVRVVPEDDTISTWLSLDGEAERRFAADEVQTFTVQINAPVPPPTPAPPTTPTPPAPPTPTPTPPDNPPANPPGGPAGPAAPAVPAGLPPGLYPFRLDAYDMADPDGTLSKGPRVTISIPPPDGGPKFPWLLVIGGAAVALIIIGVVLFLVLRNPSGPFEGHWVLNFGTMDLTHKGNTVQGTFVDQFEHNSGTVQGTASSNNSFSGDWTGNGSGSLTMTLDDANGTVSGQRIGQPGGPASWCGAREGRAFPAGCSFAGQWRTSLDGTEFNMSLSRVMSDVVGTYSLVITPTLGGQVTGTLLYNASTTQMNGTYLVSPVNTPTTRPVTGTIQFFIDGPNALQFRGSWRESSTRSGAWCGWRTDTATPVPSPVPCRRP